MIERFGIGTQQMINACRRMHNPEPEFIERENHFVVCFYSRLYEEKSLPGKELTPRQRKILQLLTDNQSMAFGDILNLLGEDLHRRTLQDELSRLRDDGLIDHEGKGRAARWFIKNS
jgi:predicted HTH transcriptional regulator